MTAYKVYYTTVVRSSKWIDADSPDQARAIIEGMNATGDHVETIYMRHPDHPIHLVEVDEWDPTNRVHADD